MSGEPPAPDARWVENTRRDHGWTAPAVSDAVLRFHRSLPGYRPTPLIDLPDLARELGVAHVVAKDESQRLGLPAFKALGASWAIHRALHDAGAGAGPDGLPVTVVAATDGNHGRAVARFAHQLGHRSHIFVPDGVHPDAVQAIHDEGADVTHVPGSYDHAVGTAADDAAGPRVGPALLVQDTSWEGYTVIPSWIVDGYSTLFTEIDDQLRDHGARGPDLVVVPTGVGSLLHAALVHYRSHHGRRATNVIAVEPVGSACVLASVGAGRPVTVDTRPTVMAGLNCGSVSTLAWPAIVAGLDAATAVTDAQSIAAARDLARLGVPAGPCGGAALAGLRAVDAAPDGVERSRRRARLTLSPAATVVLIITEGSAANPHLGQPW